MSVSQLWPPVEAPTDMLLAGRDFQIRLAAPRDAAQLAHLRWEFSREDGYDDNGQSWETFEPNFAEFWAAACASGDWVVWVAETGDRLIANTWVEMIEKVPRPGRFGTKWGYVTNVYAVPEVRNKGVGSQLMHSVIRWARAEDLELLMVWPSEASVDFYGRAGFERDPEALVLALRND